MWFIIHVTTVMVASLFICSTEAKPQDNSFAAWCPSPYRIRGNECFFVSEDKNNLLNWDEAHQKCLSMGGDLAQPQDMVDFVNYIGESYPNSKSTIWLGATDREVEQEWKWLSGEPVPPAMWKPWPHNQPSGDGNCMEIHWWPDTKFYLNDWFCHNKGHFACEINRGRASLCPEGFFPSAGQCFKFFVGWQKWTSARSTCGRNQLRMAEPKDPVAVRAYLNAHYAGQGDASWIGGRGVGSHFEWIGSKTRINDAYWAPGQPDGEGTSYEYCLRFSPSTLPNADKPFYSNPCRKVFNVLCELHGILAHSAELDGFNEDQGLVEESAQGIENSIEDLCSKMNGRCVDSKDKCSALQPMRIYNVSFPQITQKYCPFSIPYTDSPACCAPSGQVFTADIENALAFTFENTLIYNSWEVETGRIPVNYTEPVRNELRGFLMILDKYLKAPNHIHSHTKEFIGTVKRYVGDHSFSASELQQEFKDIQERRGGDVYLSAWQPSVSCHNINKGTCYNNSYLASCGLWNMFHTITVSANDPAKPLEVIQAIRGFIHDLFFCGLCRHHFLGMYKQTITKYDSVNTLDEAILWLWCAHNAVNEEWTDWQSNNHLGGWPRHPQFPLTEACPDCWPGSLGGEYHTCATLFCHGNTEPGKCFSAQFNHTTTPVIYHRFSIPHVLTYLKDVYSGPYSKLNSRKNKLIFREDITCPH